MKDKLKSWEEMKKEYTKCDYLNINCKFGSDKSKMCLYYPDKCSIKRSLDRIKLSKLEV